MTLESSLIPVEDLSEPLKKILGPQAPPQLKLMAARGLAPLGPQDLLTALYQISLDSDERLRSAALKTASGLPPKILSGGLGAALDARVLDFFARQVMGDPDLVELILLNRTTDDQTYVYLASVCKERELELLAANEERILRSPAIIEALYFNKAARMSTVDRLIELAVRHGIRCEGIPSFDSVAEAISAQGPPVFNGSDFEIDSQFHDASAAGEELEAELRRAESEQALVETLEGLMSDEDGQGPESDEKRAQRKKRIQDLPMSAKIRLATVGNASARAILIRDPNKVISLAAANSPALSDIEAVAIAQNRQVVAEVIMAIARNKGFLKSYQVKIGLAFNPKTPLAIVLRVIPHLHESDVKMLAKSKNVPGQVVTVARRLIEVREKKR